MADAKTKGEAKPAGTPVNAGPSTPEPRPQLRVEPEALLVTDLAPQVGEDGQVYVSAAVSDAAVEQGYAPDNQPKSQDATSVGVVKDDA